MQGSIQATGSEIAPLLVSVKVSSPEYGRSPSRDELEMIAGTLRKVLRHNDRLVVLPGICTIFILAYGQSQQASAVRDRVAQFIQSSAAIDQRRFGFELRIEQTPPVERQAA